MPKQSHKVKGEVLYMVGRIDYQYNDETYYRGENEGVVPVNLYRSKALAEHIAALATIKELQGWMGDVTHFGYEPDEVIKDEQVFVSILNKYGVEGELKSIWENTAGGDAIPEAVKLMTAEDQAAFVESLSIKFFEVSEVELAG